MDIRYLFAKLGYPNWMGTLGHTPRQQRERQAVARTELSGPSSWEAAQGYFEQDSRASLLGVMGQFCH